MRIRKNPEDFAGKGSSHIFDKFDMLLERWHNRVAIKNLTLSKRYLKAEIESGLIFDAFAGFPVIRSQYVAIFQRKLPLGCSPLQHLRGEIRNFGLPNIPLESPHGMSSGDRDQGFMFVDDVDAVQIVDCAVRSTVRLELADNFNRRLAGSVQPALEPGYEIGFIPAYWERSILRGASAPMNNECHGKVVKGRSSVVDTIADEGAPFDRDGITLCKAIDFVRG